MDFWFCFSSDKFRDNVPGICAGFDLDLRVKNLDKRPDSVNEETAQKWVQENLQER
jgi:metal-dependent amidase/aminoacylase/carboxypeptidase family protein